MLLELDPVITRSEQNRINVDRTGFLADMLSNQQATPFTEELNKAEEGQRTSKKLILEESAFSKLSEKMDEAEIIVCKKKEDEERRRREADEQRKLEEAESLKQAAEAKKKRDLEDKIMQKELQLKRIKAEESRKILAEEKRMLEEAEKQRFENELKQRERFEKIRKVAVEKEKELKLEKVKREEEFHRLKEEHFFGKDKRVSLSPNDLYQIKGGCSPSAATGGNLTQTQQDKLSSQVDISRTINKPDIQNLNVFNPQPLVDYLGLKNKSQIKKNTENNEAPSHKEEEANSVPQVLEKIGTNTKNSTKENKSFFQDESSRKVILENRIIQTSQKNDFNPITIFNESLKYSSSMRWKDVKTGLVKDRANIYLNQEDNQIYPVQTSLLSNKKPSNSTAWVKSAKEKSYSDLLSVEEENVKNRLLGEGRSLGVATGEEKALDIAAPWRKQEQRLNTKSPTLNLITVSGTKYLLIIETKVCQHYERAYNQCCGSGPILSDRDSS